MSMISFGGDVFYFPEGEHMHTTGYVDVAFCSLRYRIPQSRAYMGRSSCSPDVPWPILLIFAPFFWVVKSNMANMAALRSAVLEVYVKMVCPYDRVVSLRWRGCCLM